MRANRLSPFLPSRRTPLSERLEQADLCCVQLLTVRCGLCFKVVHCMVRLLLFCSLFFFSDLRRDSMRISVPETIVTPIGPIATSQCFFSLHTLRFIIQAFQFNGVLFIGFDQTNISSMVNKLFDSLRVTTSHCHLKRSSAFYVADV